MNYQNEMRRLVDDFVTQLADLWRQAAIDSMMGVGGGGGGGGGVAARGPGRPRLSEAAPSSRSRGSRGGKRTADELDQLQDQFLDYVKKNPGLRIEQINKTLGTSTKDLALPIRKLISDGALKVKGAKRATTYTAK